MASWAQFEGDAPEIAAAAAARWPGIVALARGERPSGEGEVFRIAYLATVRRDGGPEFTPSARSSPKGGCSRRSRDRHRRAGTCAEIRAA